MSKQNNWFNVDREGLRQLQAGKPKHYLVRELIQNAWDENVKVVKMDMEFSNPCVISIEDDNKRGFKDLTDAYTLFKETSKRENPEQRGRFNLGEKQVFSICEKAVVETTTGSILFNDEGRTETESVRKKGSKVTVWVQMLESEFDEIGEMVNRYFVPKGVKFYINGKRKIYLKPEKSFEASLTTEISDDKILRQTTRKTRIDLYKSDDAYLFEMGIPVCKIECEYSIDVQQKIPLGVDRESVSQAYLRDVFSEVLNNVFDDIDEDVSSQVWVREAMSDDRINQEAVESIIQKRYGDKVCIGDTFDPNSIDEAISNGYRVLRGNELGKQEWGIIRKFKALVSSSRLFGTNVSLVTSVVPTRKQELVANYAKKVAKTLLNVNITVTFIKERNIVAAQYGHDELTFNISKLGNSFFDETVSTRTTDLILHELGHHAGNHTEIEYHSLITKMAGELVLLALKGPEFFEIN